MRPRDLELDRLFDSVRDAVLVVEESTGRIVLWNPMAIETFGYSHSEALNELRIDTLVPEYLNAHHRAGMWRYLEKGHSRYIDSSELLDLPALRKGGKEIRIEMTLSPIESIRDLEGPEERFVLAIIRDITERKRAEEEIRKLNQELERRVAERTANLQTALAERERTEEERKQMLRDAEHRAAELNAVINSIPDAVYIGNENGISLCNDAALEMLGFDNIAELNQNIHVLAEMIQTRFADTGERIPPGEEVFELAFRGETRVREVIARHKSGRDVVLRSAAAPIWHEGRIIGAVAVNTDITERRRSEEALRESHRRIENILESITDAFVAVDREWRFTYLNERALSTLQKTRAELLGKNMWEEFPEAVGLPAYREYHRVMTSGTSVHFEEFNPSLGIWVVINAYPSVDGLAIYFRDVTERKRSEEALHEAKEAERNRLARDLHDGVLQDLTHALVEAQLTQTLSDDPELKVRLGKGIAALKRAGEGLRHAVYDLRWEKTAQGSIVSSLEDLVNLNRQMASGRYEVGLSVEEGFPRTLPGRLSTEMVRIIQEALNNSRRHSDAHRVMVRFGVEGEELVGEVSDDGRGFELGSSREGIGMSSMHERAAALGGELEVESEPGKGTTVRLRVPLLRVRKEESDEA